MIPVTSNVPPIVVAPPTVNTPGVTSEPNEPVDNDEPLIVPTESIVRTELVTAKALACISVMNNLFHFWSKLPKLNVALSSGIKLESISAVNEILSVGALPKVRLPPIVVSPSTSKSPVIFTYENEPVFDIVKSLAVIAFDIVVLPWTSNIFLVFSTLPIATLFKK